MSRSASEVGIVRGIFVENTGGQGVLGVGPSFIAENRCKGESELDHALRGAIRAMCSRKPD